MVLSDMDKESVPFSPGRREQHKECGKVSVNICAPSEAGLLLFQHQEC